ncbi:MAG TPA: hypothetical protein VHY55_07180 [Acidimicrobiia bacterium]|nr:hypothetical protein [Acidimicrobiia bacterium]
MDAAIADRDAALGSIADKLVAETSRLNLRDAEIAARNGEIVRYRARVEELERIATRLAERVVERERELRRLREELAGERRSGGEGMEALTALAGEIESLRRQARGQATRIRLSALHQAAEVSERLKEIAGRPGDAGERVVEALAGALERVGVEEDVEFAPALGGRRPRRAGDELEGLVDVEIGPLADFSQLVGFEDAARSIAAVSELSMRRFSEGRATLTLNLKEPVELVYELGERCSLPLEVRERGANRLVLDVAEPPPAVEAA